MQDHGFDCSWDSGEENTDGDGDVLMGSVTKAERLEEPCHGCAAVEHNDGSAETAAAESTNGRSDEPSSPIVVCGTPSSAELASTGVCGWEIVHSDATEAALADGRESA